MYLSSGAASSVAVLNPVHLSEAEAMGFAASHYTIGERIPTGPGIWADSVERQQRRGDLSLAQFAVLQARDQVCVRGGHTAGTTFGRTRSLGRCPRAASKVARSGQYPRHVATESARGRLRTFTNDHSVSFVVCDREASLRTYPSALPLRSHTDWLHHRRNQPPPRGSISAHNSLGEPSIPPAISLSNLSINNELNKPRRSCQRGVRVHLEYVASN